MSKKNTLHQQGILSIDIISHNGRILDLPLL